MLGASLTCLPAAATPPGQVAGETPHRIISLAPHITELLYAAGAGDRILATVDSSDYPPEARALPRIGDGLRLNAERLLSLRPDLVIAWQPSSLTAGLSAPLQAAQVPLWYVHPRRLDDLPADIARLGRDLGTPDAEPAAQALADRIAALRAQYAQAPAVTVFIDLGGDPLRTIGNDALLNDALSVCKLRNLYADAGVASPLVSMEALLAHPPDALIIAGDSLEAARHRLTWWHRWPLTAATDRRTAVVTSDWLFRPGPRLVNAVAQLCEQLQPH